MNNPGSPKLFTLAWTQVSPYERQGFTSIPANA